MAVAGGVHYRTISPAHRRRAGKARKFKNLNKWAIQNAIIEVNGLLDFSCSVEPVLSGRKVVKLKLSWWRKNTDELKAAYQELQEAKVGRRSRLRGTVDTLETPKKPISFQSD